MNSWDDDDNAAATWDESNEDINVEVLTGKTGLQVEPLVFQTPLSLLKLTFIQAIDLITGETNHYI